MSGHRGLRHVIGVLPWHRPADIKRREVEPGSHNWMVCLAAALFLNSCFSDTVLVALLRTVVEAAIRKVRKLLCTCGVPTSLTLLFWWWLTVPSVFPGQMSYSSLPDPPLSPSQIRLIVFVDAKHHERRAVHQICRSDKTCCNKRSFERHSRGSARNRIFPSQ